MPKKKTREEFIQDAREKHGDKYDYSKVEYMNNHTKVCIICPDHGEFWQTPHSHTQGQGCPKCYGKYAPTTEEWITSAHEVHGEKYDYSKVKYVNNTTKVCIKCPKHGEFEQTPASHIKGAGCPKCGIEKIRESLSFSKEDFIKKVHKIHGDKYDYSKVEYVNNHTKVCIVCPDHGEFWQTPNSHLRGNGCSKCSGLYVPTKEEWIASARKIHSDKYDYSKVKYVNNTTKVCIKCPKHGEFWQKPNNHTQGQGCPKCGIEKNAENQTLTKEEFIKNAKEVHGKKYEYSKVNYVNNSTKVTIICPKHGEFWQTPNSHTQGVGCPKCAYEDKGERCRSSKEDFIKKALEIHKGKYDYSNVNYVNSKTKVSIICPEHGEFKQKPNGHLSGAGCPMCNLSHLERSVMNYLDDVGIIYDYQKRFNWLGKQSLDFYLPDYNVSIECQGKQHFFPVDFAGRGVEWACKEFDKLISRDKRKKALCDKHGIKLLYFGNVPNYNTFLGEVVHDDAQYLIDYLKNNK